MAQDDVTPATGAQGDQVGQGPPFRSFWDGARNWAAGVVSYVTGGGAGAWTLQAVDATHGLPVSVVPPSPAITDHSVASLTGGATSDQLLPAGTVGRWTYIFNPEGNDVITLNMLGGAAVAGTIGCIDIAPGGKLELPFVPSAAIKVHGTAAQVVVCLTA